MNDGWEDDEEQGEDEPKQWLSMQDAVDLLAAANSLSRAAAKDSILDLLSDGRLQLRCQSHFNPNDVDNVVWNSSKWVLVPRSCTSEEKAALIKSARERRSQEPPPIEKRFRPQHLPADYWQKRDGWNIDASKIDWVSGALVGVKSVKAGKSSDRALCRAANGVEIMRDLAIFPLSSAEQTHDVRAAGENSVIDEEPINYFKNIRKTTKGRKRLPAWDAWIAEVAVYIEENEMNFDLGAEKFHQFINERIFTRDSEQELLDFSTVQSAISAIRNRCREARARNGMG